MIGINVAVRVGAQGIAFAIPVDRAMEVAAALLSAEQAGGTWHGLVGRSEVHNREWSYTVDRVAAGSPAAESGLRSGDRVVRIGNTTIRRQLDVERAFLGVAPGAQIDIEVVRHDQTMPVQLVVADVADTPRMAPECMDTARRPLISRSRPASCRQYQPGFAVVSA